MAWPGGVNPPGGMYVLNRNVDTDGRVYLQDNTWLILCDGCTLDVKGLYVPEGKTLTIYGQSLGSGKIYSHPGNGTGIGGSEDHVAGNIVIHGGTIQAIGADHCAGIGSNDGQGSKTGSFTMYGGTVRSTGNQGGAGIGGGRNSDGGTIKIYGGTVTATARNSSSAGIGGGDPTGERADNSIIEIYGGTITATGADKGAGIGGGEYGHATINISGGTITAKGGYQGGAGIGCGADGSKSKISIMGGKVNATPGSEGGSGIGNGKNGSGSTITLGYTDNTAENFSVTSGSYGGTVNVINKMYNTETDTNIDSANNIDKTLIVGTLKAVLETISNPVFNGHAILLTGRIGLQFLLELPEGATPENYPESYVTFEGNKVDSTAEYAMPASTFLDTGRYMFQTDLSSIQMADKITPVFHYTEGGEEKTVTGAAYSVKDYIDWAVDAGQLFLSDREKTILPTLANYGHYAQPYLSGQNHWTIGTDYAEMPAYDDETSYN